MIETKGFSVFHQNSQHYCSSVNNFMPYACSDNHFSMPLFHLLVELFYKTPCVILVWIDQLNTQKCVNCAIYLY